MVRHGRAAAGFDQDRDPGLDEVGRSQAEAMATKLAPEGPLPILTSPLRRTRETASALERRWGTAARIEPRIAEIPSPVSDLAARGQWLREIAPRRWPELDPALRAWRDDVVQALKAIPEDTVLVSHFIPLNVAVGYATGDDRLICFQPDNCSCTVFDNTGGQLAIATLGGEAVTRVL
jgi:broad specificity phosphatase PhoE